MPTVLEPKELPTCAPAAAEEAPARSKRKLPTPYKTLAALLAAGLAVPNIEASFLPTPGIEGTLGRLEREYQGLRAQNAKLQNLPQARPAFQAMLYLDGVAERFIPATWASLPGDGVPAQPYSRLLAEEEFLNFLSAKGADGKPLLTASDAVRVYGATLVASRVFHIPPSLLLCLFVQESRLRSEAVSPTGAEGVGQLTGIALEQVELLLSRSTRWRERLRHYEDTLSSVYGDPTSRLVLSTLVPELRLPVMQRINRVSRAGVSDELVRRVGLLLERKHPELACNRELLGELCTQLRSGKGLEERHAPVARAYRIAQTEVYNVQTGNTFNPETNVGVSALLFRYYMRYPWSLEEQRLNLPYGLRAALAVLAYNQGPEAAKRILGVLAERGKLNGRELDAQELLQIYDEELVNTSIGTVAGMRPAELHRHFLTVMSCALASPPPVEAEPEGPPAELVSGPAEGTTVIGR